MNTHIHPLFQAILAPYTPPQRDPRWVAVAKAFDNAHDACECCEHKLVTVDRGVEEGRYGERYYSECTLGQDGRDHPGMCPAIQPTEESEEQP